MIKDSMGGKSHYNPFAEKYKKTLKDREKARKSDPKKMALESKKKGSRE